MTKFQNKVSREIDQKKNVFYQNMFNNCQGNTREQWRIVNSIIGGTEKGEIRKVILDNRKVV